MNTLEHLRYPTSIPLTTDLLFDRTGAAFIRPSSRVLVVGPGIDYKKINPVPLPLDPSLIVLPNYIQRGGGNLTILEAPRNSWSANYGDHSVQLLRDWFSYLQEVFGDKFPICKRKFIERDLKKSTEDFGESFDCIYDHLTTDHWLLNGLKPHEIYKKMKELVKFFSSHLVRGGKLILHHTRLSDQDLYQSAFEEAQLITSTVNLINDEYELPPILKDQLKKTGYGFRIGEQDFFTPVYLSYGIIVGVKK